MQNWQSTIASQYGSVLTALLGSFNDAVDPVNDINHLYNKARNLDTAHGWGLDVWGRILVVSRVVYMPGVVTGKTLGFEEMGTTDADPFGQSSFASNASAPDQAYALSDGVFRTLLIVKAFSNICDRSIQTFNAGLLMLFPGRGDAWVSEGAMQMTMNFAFQLTDVEVAILKQTGVLPGPSGVQVLIHDSTGYR